MRNLQIVTLRPEHSAIVPHLRQQDINEINASCDWSVRDAVVYSITHSERGFAAILDGRPCAVFGVHQGIIWLVGTDDIEKYPITFYRLSKKIFPSIKAGYPVLENFVHADNTLSLRWLQWLGFTVEPPHHNFHHVYYVNKEE